MLLNDIQKYYSNFIKVDCEEHNCKINLKKPYKYIILDGDELIGPKYKSCDCIIFHVESKLYISLVELKSTLQKRNIDQIKGKFEYTIKYLNEILKKISYKDHYFITLVLLRKSHRSYSFALDYLISKPLQIGQTLTKINIQDCGYCLNESHYDKV